MLINLLENSLLSLLYTSQYWRAHPGGFDRAHIYPFLLSNSWTQSLVCVEMQKGPYGLSP